MVGHNTVEVTSICRWDIQRESEERGQALHWAELCTYSSWFRDGVSSWSRTPDKRDTPRTKFNRNEKEGKIAISGQDKCPWSID